MVGYDDHGKPVHFKHPTFQVRASVHPYLSIAHRGAQPGFSSHPTRPGPRPPSLPRCALLLQTAAMFVGEAL